MDQREYVVDWEETLRTAFAGLMAGQWHAMPGRATEASADGHNAVVQIAVKRLVTNVQTGEQTYEDHPVHPDTVVHFPGGASTVLTHGIAEGDEGMILYGNRNIDGWRQDGATQPPVDGRMSGYQDPHWFPGLRSDPRKLQQVDTQAAHLRSDDKTAVYELHPTNGVQSFHADPSTPPASASFDPLTMATTFYRHVVQSATGILGSATSGSTTHTHGVTHAAGAFMTALNSLHSVLCHPSQGASLNAQNLLHSVTAGPLGAIMSAFGGKHTVSALASGLSLQSAAGISLSCPAGGLSLPAGGVGGSALAEGAASSNVGALSGDLAGSLPDPTVTGLHVDFSQYPAATSDSAAAAAGVGIGGLYRDTSVAAGKSYLAVRMS